MIGYDGTKTDYNDNTASIDYKKFKTILEFCF